MLRKSVTFLLSVVFLAAFSVPVPAWDDVGHKLTAYIAWQQMTPAVREKVIKILRAAPEDSQLSAFYLAYGSRTDESKKLSFFMTAATWPDIVRDRDLPVRYKKYHHSNWHYSDTFWTTTDGRSQLVTTQDENGKAMDKLAEFNEVIRSNASDEQKAIAVSWLEHIIGDLHQPLHASGRITDLEPKGDQGGNLFLLTPKGTPRDKQENLHWFWDSIIVRALPNSRDLCDPEYIDPIGRRIMKKYPFSRMRLRLNAGNFEEWKTESLTAAENDVYSPDLKRFQMPSAAYKKKALRVAEERIALAGYRMADLFNSVFGAD